MEKPNRIRQSSVISTFTEKRFFRWMKDDVSVTLRSRSGSYGGGSEVFVIQKNMKAYCIGNGQVDQLAMKTVVGALNCMHDEMAVMLTKEGDEGMATTVVRRLTPKEYERLQGFDDDWTNIGEWVDSKGKKHKDADSPRYKALGNSICLPFWQWMAYRMVEQYPEEKRSELTMASLFDGIGGFPLVYQRAGVEPVWASEIEEFPIAVTKLRFPDNK